MNWFLEPNYYYDNYDLQQPQPQLFLASSTICKPQIQVQQLAFQQFDFVIDRQESEKEEEAQAQPSTIEEATRKKRSKPRYEKNICGYVLKKALRAFISNSYRNVAEQTCQKHGASFEEAKNFCLDRMEKINGPSHLKIILVPVTRGEIGFKGAITQFLEWFIRQRYTRHLILEGKMSNKETYILYKNKFFPKEISKFKRMAQQFVDIH